MCKRSTVLQRSGQKLYKHQCVSKLKIVTRSFISLADTRLYKKIQQNKKNLKIVTKKVSEPHSGFPRFDPSNLEGGFQTSDTLVPLLWILYKNFYQRRDLK